MSDATGTDLGVEDTHPCFCGDAGAHSEYVPLTKSVRRGLCPEDPRLSEETVAAIRRVMSRLAVRRAAAAEVAAMDPAVVRRLRRQMDV